MQYGGQIRTLVAVDCIIFGFDGQELKLLLIHRGFEPEKGKWSLMGGFVQADESLEMAAARILRQLTGLQLGDFAGNGDFVTLAPNRT